MAFVSGALCVALEKFWDCSIVVPSANRIGHQIYWNFVRGEMLQKIAKTNG